MSTKAVRVQLSTLALVLNGCDDYVEAVDPDKWQEIKDRVSELGSAIDELDEDRANWQAEAEAEVEDEEDDE